MIKEIFISKKYSDIRLMIGISASITILLWIKDSLEISCLLALIQNVLLVLFITARILNRMSIGKIQRIKNGVIIGASLGVVYSTMGSLVEGIDYYFFGGRFRAASDLGLPFFPLSYDLLLTEIITQIWIWLFLVLVSLACGFIAGVISRERNMVK